MRAAHERIAAQAQEAERSFTDPYWPLHRALAWIAFRDRGRIEQSWSYAIFQERPYVKDRDPRTSLLRALHLDRLRAINRNGNKLSPRKWAHVTKLDLPLAHQSSRKPNLQVKFTRADMLRVWPEINETSKSAAARTVELNTAIKIISDALLTNNDLTRGEAKKILAEKNVDVSLRQFQGKVWPEARILAGLNRFAQAGAKKRLSSLKKAPPGKRKDY